MPSRRSAGWSAGIWAVGAIQTLGQVNLPELIARFHRRHPAVTLRIHHDGAPELVRRTADGVDLDLVQDCGDCHEDVGDIRAAVVVPHGGVKDDLLADCVAEPILRSRPVS